MTYKRTISEIQDSLHNALVMLQSDPHFQTFVELLKDGREVMVRQICQEGVSAKDIDRYRGAIYFADEILRNTVVKHKNGNGVRNTGLDHEQEFNRG